MKSALAMYVHTIADTGGGYGTVPPPEPFQGGLSCVHILYIVYHYIIITSQLIVNEVRDCIFLHAICTNSQ